MPVKNIVIVGGGPVGSALACYLRRYNRNVVIFADGKRPELLIGESLVPSVLGFLRELNLEEEIKSIGTHKPGATFYMRPNDETTFSFMQGQKNCPNYAYNVPRLLFDDVLARAAVREGAHIISESVKLVADGGRISLPDTARVAAESALGGAIDFIVDATGRRRQIAHLLNIPAVEGGRKDTALFAHFDKVAIRHPGNIHVNRLSRGWCWRIPLPGRISVGIVVPGEVVSAAPGTSAERYDQIVQSDPTISEFIAGGKRITPVMKYSNYQLTSNRMFGEGWAMVGDAAGFIDPIFSSGLLIGFTGARLLAQELSRSEPNLQRYEASLRRHLGSWQRVVDYFYDGRLFSLIRKSRYSPSNRVSRVVGSHVERHVVRVLTGVEPENPYSQWVTHASMKYVLRPGQGERLRVR